MKSSIRLKAPAVLANARFVQAASRSRFPASTPGILVLAVVFALAVGTGVTDVQAGIVPPFVTVQFGTDSSNLETATIEFPNLPEPLPKPFTVSIADPVELRDGQDNLIGTIEDLDITIDPDPLVIMNFAVLAGNFPANFNITSALVNFPALVNPTAFASAGFSATDGSTPGNGVSVDLISPNTGLFTAEYNGGTEFAALLAGQSTAVPTTISSSSDTGFPPGVLNATVSSIQSHFDFRLSANDRLAGNGRFEVLIPEPSSLMILIVGLLASCRFVRRLS